LGWELHNASQILDEINYNWPPNASALLMHPSASLGIWTDFQLCLHYMGQTLQRLKSELIPIVSNKKRGIFGSSSKAWTFGMHIGAITELRKRLPAHYATLKVGACMMRLLVSLKLPYNSSHFINMKLAEPWDSYGVPRHKNVTKLWLCLTLRSKTSKQQRSP
jgi:hypothetical protein